MNRQTLLVCPMALLAAVAAAAGCGDSGAGARGGDVPWDNGRVALIDTTGQAETVDSDDAQACEADPSVCDDESTMAAEGARQCGEDAADVIVSDENGEVLDVICYGEDVLSVEEIAAADGDIAQSQNGVAILLDAEDDGVDIDGDLNIDANSVVVYGEGPAVSVISGDVAIDGNNIIVRGVHVQGSVTLLKNNSVILYCAIDGDLTLDANNAHVSGCDIFGNVVVNGMNNVLAGNHIAGTLTDNANHTSCTGNVAFVDANADGLVSDDELGEELGCGGKEPGKK